MISLNRILDDQRLIKDRTFFWLVDVVLNQYLTALGEFATLDAFTGDDDDVTVVKASQLGPEPTIISSLEDKGADDEDYQDFNSSLNLEKNLVIIVFLLTTFYTQITMLNMLIAIMGNVFDELEEQKDVGATATKLEILADLAPVLGL